MFEEALQKAPREELVEHIRLQRELIQRLHRRIIELEASLERACADATSAKGKTDQQFMWSPTEEDKANTEKRSASQRSSSSRRRSWSVASVVVSPRARKPAWVSTTSKHRALPASSQLPERHTSTTTSIIPANLEEELTSSSAPEPRRELPLPYVEKSTSLLSSSFPVKADALVASAPELDQMVPIEDYKGASASPSPPADHLTVLEGIKEINYVLAAHRAGRPALPLAVVEELEAIRGRLLQGFKQVRLSCGVLGSEEEDSGDNSRRRHPASWTRDSKSLEDAAHTHVHAIHQSFCNREETDEGTGEASRVCPRWVSPDSSRVVYGESPHRHW